MGHKFFWCFQRPYRAFSRGITVDNFPKPAALFTPRVSVGIGKCGNPVEMLKNGLSFR
jgi:hypothetical protein